MEKIELQERLKNLISESNAADRNPDETVVYMHLMVITLTNSLNPLPWAFPIYNVMLNQGEIESIMELIGLDVDIDTITHNGKGNSFLVRRNS